MESFKINYKHIAISLILIISFYLLFLILSDLDSIMYVFEFLDKDYTGHYVSTPYYHRNPVGMKYIPPLHVDLGQGILQMINEINKSELVCQADTYKCITGAVLNKDKTGVLVKTGDSFIKITEYIAKDIPIICINVDNITILNSFINVILIVIDSLLF